MSLGNVPPGVPVNCDSETIQRFVYILVAKIRKKAYEVNFPFVGRVVGKDGAEIAGDTGMNKSGDLLEHLESVLMRLLTTDTPNIILSELEAIFQLMDDKNINSVFLEFAQRLNCINQAGHRYISHDNAQIDPFDHENIRRTILYKLRKQNVAIKDWIEHHPLESKKEYPNFDGIFSTPLGVYISASGGLKHIDIDPSNIVSNLSGSRTIKGSQYFVFTEKSSGRKGFGYSPRYYDVYGDQVYPEIDGESVVFMKMEWGPVYVYLGNWIGESDLNTGQGSIGELDTDTGTVTISQWLGLLNRQSNLVMQKK